MCFMYTGGMCAPGREWELLLKGIEIHPIEYSVKFCERLNLNFCVCSLELTDFDIVIFGNTFILMHP